MDAELFATEWQSLKEKRQKLLDEATQLRRKLSSLTTETPMMQLLEEMARLRKKVPNLKQEVEWHDRAIQGRKAALERRHRALLDKNIKRELERRLKERRRRLAYFEKTYGPDYFLMENARRLVFEVEAPIHEVAQHYERMNAAERQQQEAHQQLLDEALARIAAIEEHYQHTKECLEVAIREVEQGRQQCRRDEIEWATQSHRHLKWMLEHEPSYKDEVVRRYTARFPTDDLSDLLPATPASTFSKTSGKKRKSQPGPPSSAVSQEILPAAQPWRFWITFDANDAGQELPQEVDQFLKNLQSAFDRAAYRSLKPQLVYDKLLLVTRMTTQQRQEMNKVVDLDPLGWKKLRVGKKHRLFLWIDEESRFIRFLPYQRKKAYGQH